MMEDIQMYYLRKIGDKMLLEEILQLTQYIAILMVEFMTHSRVLTILKMV